MVPASYFIGSDGVPVEVIGGSVSKDVFLQKALSVLEVRCVLVVCVCVLWSVSVFISVIIG